MKKYLKKDHLFFILPFLVVLVVAIYLVFGLKFIYPDALSRSFHAYTVFFGNQPKFANIGFVWPPVPTLAALPFVLIKPLNIYGFVGNAMSALFLGMTTLYLNKIFKFFSLNLKLRIALIALFLLNPMILLYGANGMSEMIACAFFVATAFHLLSYIKKENILHLIGASVATALGIMTRYELMALTPAIVLILIFMRVDNIQNIDKKTFKRIEGDVVLYGLPIVFAMGIWVIANWAIMHNPFYFMNSVYSNTSQSSQLMTDSSYYRDLSHNMFASFLYAAQRVTLLFPAFLIFVFLTVTEPLRKHNWTLALALLALPFSILFFHTFLLYQGQSFGWLRFFIYIIPASFMLCAFLLDFCKDIKYYKIFIGVALFLSFFSSLWTTYAMADAQFGKEEHVFVKVVTTHDTSELNDYSYAQSLEIANYLKTHVTDGRILVDDFTGFSIIYLSGDTSRFIQTIDSDFQKSLHNLKKDKAAQYILVRKHGGLGDLDAINRKYPTMFEDGANIAKLEHDFGTWRLYKKM